MPMPKYQLSGGPGSTAGDVYTDYFAGIEAFDLTQYDDYFAGGGEVDINWIDPGAGNDEIHGVGSVFTVLDYSSVSNEFGVYFYNDDYSMPVFDLSANTLGTHDAGLYPLSLWVHLEQKSICSSETDFC